MGGGAGQKATLKFFPSQLWTERAPIGKRNPSVRKKEALHRTPRQRNHLRCQVQNVRLWKCHRLQLVYDRACKGSFAGRRRQNQKHGDCEGARASTCQTPLLKCVYTLLSSLNFLLTLSIPVLAEDAIRSAIKDYRSKRSKLAETKQKRFIDVAQSSSRSNVAPSQL